MAAAPTLSLKARALRWLAQRERSRAELRRRLLPHARAEAADDASERVDALLDGLERDGHLSAERFVESRLNARVARIGSRRLEAELAEHGLGLSAEQRAALQRSEFDRARGLWQRRFGGAPAAEPAEAARQSRFLLARGFAPEVVRLVIRGAEEPRG